MCSSVSALLSANTLLFLGVLQTLGATVDPKEDPAYQLFEMQIQSEKQQAEYKLNSSREIYENKTKTFNLPDFDNINSTLYKCFEDVKAKYTYADEYCLQSVEQDVQQIISDSENELAACSELTHSWELIGQLIKGAEDAIAYLEDVVNKMLTAALGCVTRYPNNPTLKNKCFSFTKNLYSAQWDNATALAQEAYYQISGGDLLLGAEVSSCRRAESFSFTDKCYAIVSEVEINCVPSTTSSITPTPTPYTTTTTTSSPTNTPPPYTTTTTTSSPTNTPPPYTTTTTSSPTNTPTADANTTNTPPPAQTTL